MEQTQHSKNRFVFGGAVLTVAALLLLFGVANAHRASAQAHPGVNFTMSVVGHPGCDTSQGNALCELPPGSSFVVNVTLGPLPADVPSYEGYDIELDFTGFTSLNDASTSSWPDCAYPAASYGTPGAIRMGCAIGAGAAPSTYTGLIGKVSFNCAQSGIITMPHGNTRTDLLQNIQTSLLEPGPSESLDISCGPRPTPTSPAVAATATPTPAPGLSSTGSGGISGTHDNRLELWLAVGAVLVCAAGLSLMSWRFARSR
jgi:hypothetical protein